MNAFAKAYRATVDHLTKVLGVIGLGVLSATDWIDPDMVMGAAARFINDDRLQHRLGEFLFALVIVRGWYAGRKFKQLKAAAQPPPGTPQ